MLLKGAKMSSGNKSFGRSMRRVSKAGRRLLGLAGVAALAYYLLEKNKQKTTEEPVIIDTTADFDPNLPPESNPYQDDNSF